MTRGWQTHARSGRDRRRKKSRQQRSPAQAARQSPRSVASAQHTSAEAPRPVAGSSGWRSTAARAPVAGQMIRPEEYTYVYSDLKRIAVLGGGIFAVLIILSFIIK